MSRLSAEIEHAFRSGALILTANLRAALWLRHEYALLMKGEGRQAWTTPPIEDWDSWIRRLWQSASLAEDDAPMLLSDLQEAEVWLRMQRDDANLLVSPEGMAKLSVSAYALLCSYEAHAERNHKWEHTDAERFQQWAAAFDRECQRQRWLSRGHLESRIAPVLHDGPLAMSEDILLVGFDRLTPAQQHLLDAMRAQGSQIVAAAPGNASQIALMRANDLRDEVTVCARWTRRLLESTPGRIRIGVVLPDLASARGEMERIFRRVLMPETGDISVEPSALPFEFSLGQPLATVPVIKAALLLLRWIAAPLSEEEVSWLLLSGFLISSTSGEMLAAARFDASLRDARSLSTEISLPEIRLQMDPARWPVLGTLQQQLLQMERTAAANNFADERREPSRWIDLVQSLLRQAGWPGSRKADTTQYQAIAKWERVLEDIALLDFQARRISFADFLHTLASHAEETLFAVESQGAPVQIMGALEASGQRFDALWFLGADDASWPLRRNTHPLLPYEVQKKTGMPHPAPEADFELSRAITASLSASAPTVVISHAVRNKDGELRPSPLIGIASPQQSWETSHEWRARLAIPTEDHVPAALEEIADSSGLIAWPREQNAGGSDVLELQAACPFKAFAAKRLHATPLNRSDWGLTAGERGELLHKVLERIWSPEFGKLHTLDDLLIAKRENRLHDTVDGVIAEVFAREIGASASNDPWMQAYLDCERKTLCRRIEEWLEIEAARVPFTVIACEEKLKDVNVGGLKLRLRADRIDEVANFARLLIDYKTGQQVSTADWTPPRPNQPQLPLYAAFGNVDDVRGLLFARLRAGETCFIGKVADAKSQLFADAKGTSPLVKNPYLDVERDRWAEALMQLASDFRRGEAAVDPKEGRKTCEHCALPGLCRIAERPAALIDEGPETDDD